MFVTDLDSIQLIQPERLEVSFLSSHFRSILFMDSSHQVDSCKIKEGQMVFMDIGCKISCIQSKACNKSIDQNFICMKDNTHYITIQRK